MRAFWYLTAVILAVIEIGLIAVANTASTPADPDPRAIATALLSAAPLIPDSVIVDAHPQPAPTGPMAEDLARLYRSQVAPDDAVDYIAIHLPPGAIIVSRTESGAATAPRATIAYTTTAVVGTEGDAVTYAFSLDGASTLYRVDATATVRSRTESVAAGSSATIVQGTSTTMLRPASAAPLVHAFDALAPAAHAPQPCGASAPATITFERADGAPPLVATFICGELHVTVDGVALQELEPDPGWFAALQQLSSTPGGAVGS